SACLMAFNCSGVAPATASAMESTFAATGLPTIPPIVVAARETSAGTFPVAAAESHGPIFLKKPKMSAIYFPFLRFQFSAKSFQVLRDLQPVGADGRILNFHFRTLWVGHLRVGELEFGAAQGGDKFFESAGGRGITIHASPRYSL